MIWVKHIRGCYAQLAEVGLYVHTLIQTSAMLLSTYGCEIQHRHNPTHLVGLIQRRHMHIHPRDDKNANVRMFMAGLCCWQ